jgi:AcrR family transcriptional regulator
VLDIAEALVQPRGFNAFTYADIARAIGIRKASLHHYCTTKADRGVALVARYCSAFLDPVMLKYSVDSTVLILRRLVVDCREPHRRHQPEEPP